MASQQDSQNLISRLEQWKIIPDVIDSFAPQAQLVITYGSTPLLTGSALRQEGVQDPPEIKWEGEVSDSSLYTLVLVDPDAPKPSEPSAKEFVHWIISNIPGSYSPTCQTLSKVTTEVLSYSGPHPVEGNHRYVFVLYKQDGKVELPAPSKRENFSVRNFAKENGLGTPVFSDSFFTMPPSDIKSRN